MSMPLLFVILMLWGMATLFTVGYFAGKHSCGYSHLTPKTTLQ